MRYGSRFVRGLVAVCVCLTPAAVVAQVVLQPGIGAPGGQTVPSQGCDLALSALARGDFTNALEIATREHRGSIRAGGQRWIDSIATAAVLGECHFERGGFREAVAAYDEAILLSAVQPDWLLRIQFPPQELRPLPQQRVATWGRSRRNTQPAGLPSSMSIRQEGSDPQRVMQQGGVLAGPVNFPVRPQEIMRALVIAIYRRTVILGETGRDGAAIDEAAKALLRRLAPNNHYSQSWIDVALGAVLWAQGKGDQAQPLLNRGLLVGNQFDHPLTCWGLIILGRLALDADKPADAAALFEEATYTAADFGDARALEEAFRLAATAHMVAGTRGVPATIRGAADWARVVLPVLRAMLLGMEAEALAITGDAQAAAAALADIDGRLLSGDPGRGQVGAQQAYAASLTHYAAGNMILGDRDMERALTIARGRSPGLFQTSRLAESMLAGGSSISDRQADALFAKLLGDPSPRDVASDPLGSLVLTCTPRTEAHEAWLAAATRRGPDAALNAAESAVRSRWLASQPAGGRRTAVLRLLATDPDSLSPAESARRAALLARHPDVSGLLDDIVRTRTPLTAALLAAAGTLAKDQPQPGPGDVGTWKEYRQAASRLGPLVAGIAAGRDAPPLGMPPLTPTAEIRRRLAPGQLMLSFHWTASGLTGALESHDRVATWQVKQSASLTKDLAGLAKALSLFDPVAAVSTDRLLAGDWQGSMDKIERVLFENSKIALAEGIEELVIVPDGMLWYLPFELLPVGSEKPAGPGAAGEPPARRRLRDVCRTRYCPTRSLAVLPADPRGTGGPVGIYAGRLMRGDKPEVAQELSDRLITGVDRAVPLSTANAAAPPALAASLLDTLVVFEELAIDGPAATRPLVTSQPGRPGVTFDEWLDPPGKRPRCILLPGLQSAMAGGLAKPPARPGDEIFLAIADLMAAGARTVLASRWRCGGESSIDLVEEFLRDQVGQGQDAAETPAAESWRRAVDIVTAEQPDLAREPRIRHSPKAILEDTRHPFFWAGYLLADCGAGSFSVEPSLPALGQPAAQRPPAAAAPAPVGPVPAPPAAVPKPQPPSRRRPLNPAAPPNAAPAAP